VNVNVPETIETVGEEPPDDMVASLASRVCMYSKSGEQYSLRTYDHSEIAVVGSALQSAIDESDNLPKSGVARNGDQK
jgi:hypothetical protein